MAVDEEGAAPLRAAQEAEQHLNIIRQRQRAPLEAAVAQGELTGPQRAVMYVLVQSQGLSLKELSRSVGLAHSTVSGIVDRLEVRGMVVRRKDEKDGRATVIQPSDEVRDFLQHRMPELTLSPLVEAMQRATDAERAMVLRGLKKLRALLEKAP